MHCYGHTSVSFLTTNSFSCQTANPATTLLISSDHLLIFFPYSVWRSYFSSFCSLPCISLFLDIHVPFLSHHLIVPKNCFTSYSLFIFFLILTSSPVPCTDTPPRPICISFQPVFVSDGNCNVLRYGRCLPLYWLWKTTASQWSNSQWQVIQSLQ